MKWAQTKRDLRQWLNEERYRNGYISGLGSTRQVWLFDDFVVKLGGYSNEVENEVWEALKDTEYATDLMPVLAFVKYDHNLDKSDFDRGQFESALFMRKATKIHLSEAEVAKCESRLAVIGIIDGCDFNFGRYRNKIRMLDYACIGRLANLPDSPLYKVDRESDW